VPRDGQPDREAHARQQRIRLLTHARRLFAEQGFHATSMGDIARAGGISETLLHRYFPGKREMLNALVAEGLQGLRDLSSRASVMLASRTTPFPVALERLGRELLDYLDHHRDLLVILVIEAQTLRAENQFARLIDRLAHEIGGAYAQRVALGELRAGMDGYLMGRQFVEALTGHTLLQQVLGGRRVSAIASADYLRALVAAVTEHISVHP